MAHKIIIRSYKRIRWLFQIIKITKYIKSSNLSRIKLSGNILVIAPHADDELIGCHQLITTYKKNVTVFYCSFLGSNSNSDNKNVRRLELEGYLNSIPVNYVISSDKVTNDLSNIIDNLKPKYIFLPSYIDWHKEHRLINEIICGLDIEDSIKIGWYHVSMPIPNKFVNYYFNLSIRQFREKWHSMCYYYVSQKHIDTDRFKLIEIISSGIESFGRETYRIMSYKQLKEYVKRFGYRQHDLDDLKSALGNIQNMYESMYLLYNEMINEN